MKMRITNLFKFSLGIIAIAIIISCSLSTKMEATVERDVEATSALKEKAKVPAKKAVDDVVRVKDDIWLGDKSVVEFEGEPLPNYLETKDGVTLVSNRPISLYEIGDMINKVTSLKVRYASKLEQDAFAAAADNAPTMENMNAGWAEPSKMLVSYKGPLSGLLDEISSRFGIWWKYENREIYFYKYITKTFVLYSLPTKQSVNTQIGGQSTGSGGGGSSSVSLTTTADLEFWQSVDTAISSMVDADAKFSIDSASGVVSLTATPSDIKKVAQYINEQNMRLARQVAVSVKVFQVTISDSDKYGLDLSAAFNDGTAVETENGLVKTGGSLLGMASPRGALGDDIANNLTMSLLPGNWDITASIKALSQQGTTSLVTSGTVTTLNNKPAPIQVVRKQNYISEITKTNSGGDANYYDLSVETKEVEVGFTLDVLPRVLEHGRVMLMFNLTLSDLLDLEKVIIGNEDDGQYIQNPIIESRGFSQEVAMKSGESLVLTGYEKTNNQVNKTGVGSADNPWLGGSVVASKDRNVLVIILTPVILNTPLTPESRMDM
jgi:type IVB pilus formation R64 PilN family outer membrane protein